MAEKKLHRANRKAGLQRTGGGFYPRLYREEVHPIPASIPGGRRRALERARRENA